MNDAPTVFVIAPESAPEVVLFAASIGRSMSRGNDVRFVTEEPEELFVRDPALSKLLARGADIDLGRAKVVLCGDADLVRPGGAANEWKLSIVADPSPTVRLETRDSRHGFPLVMSSAILRRFGRNVFTVPRIVVVMEDGSSRRDRMIARTCEELAARKWPHVLVAVSGSGQAARRIGAAEIHLQSDASDLAALMTSATLLLDPVEGDEPPSALSCLASSVGVPVVTHGTSLLVRRQKGELREVAEWSPDAFADAIMAAAPSTPTDLSWGVEFDAVAEDFGRVIQSA